MSNLENEKQSSPFSIFRKSLLNWFSFVRCLMYFYQSKLVSLMTRRKMSEAIQTFLQTII